MSFASGCKSCDAQIDSKKIRGGFVRDGYYCIPCMITWIKRLIAANTHLIIKGNADWKAKMQLAEELKLAKAALQRIRDETTL